MSSRNIKSAGDNFNAEKKIRADTIGDCALKCNEYKFFALSEPNDCKDTGGLANCLCGNQEPYSKAANPSKKCKTVSDRNGKSFKAGGCGDEISVY